MFWFSIFLGFVLINLSSAKPSTDVIKDIPKTKGGTVININVNEQNSDDAVDALKKELKDLQSKTQYFEGTVLKSLSDLETKNSDLKNEVLQLEEKNKVLLPLVNRTNTLESENANVKKEVNALKVENGNLKQKLDGIMSGMAHNSSDFYNYYDEIAEAVCASRVPIQQHAWIYAVRRPACSYGLGHPTRKVSCNAICSDPALKQQDPQIAPSSIKNVQCISALHVYPNRPKLASDIGQDTRQLGLKVLNYICTTTECGPNFCCCMVPW